MKLLWNFIEIALRHGCSPVNSLHIFRTPFPSRNTSGWLLLNISGIERWFFIICGIRLCYWPVIYKQIEKDTWYFSLLESYSYFRWLCDLIFVNKRNLWRREHKANNVKKIHFSPQLFLTQILSLLSKWNLICSGGPESRYKVICHSNTKKFVYKAWSSMILSESNSCFRFNVLVFYVVFKAIK